MRISGEVSLPRVVLTGELFGVLNEAREKNESNGMLRLTKPSLES